MTRGLWLADFQQEFPMSELRCSCSSGAGHTTLSTEVAASVALHCRKLGRDRTNALIAVRQTSFTAGTIMHRSKLPLTAWFRAAHLVTNSLE